MTVASSTDRATFPGNGVTQIFPLPFRFFENSHVVAMLIDNVTGLVSGMTIGLDYTLTGAGEPEVDGSATGVLTTTSPVPSGQTLFVLRSIPVTQPTDIINQGRFFPETHETVFDRLTMIAQQNAGSMARALRVQDYDPVPARLPGVGVRSGKLLSFDSNGDPIAVAAASQSATDLEMRLAETDGAGIVGYSNSETFPDDTVGKELGLLLKTQSAPPPRRVKNRAIVSFIFDDGYAGTYTVVAPLFVAKGFRAGFAINSKSPALGLAGATTFEQFRVMQALGHEIINHGATHANLSAGTENTYLAQSEIEESQRDLFRLGFDVQTFVAANSTTANVHIDNYLRPTHCSGFTVFNDATGVSALQASNLDPFKLHRLNLFTAGLAGAKATIDVAIANKGWVCFYDHDPLQVGFPNSMSLADLTELLDYCIAQDVDVMIPRDAIDAIYSSTTKGRRIDLMSRRASTEKAGNLLIDAELNSLSSSTASAWFLTNNGASGTGVPTAKLGSGVYHYRRILFSGNTADVGEYVLANTLSRFDATEAREGTMVFAMDVFSSSANVNTNFDVSIGIQARKVSDNTAIAGQETGKLYLDQYTRRYYASISLERPGEAVYFQMFMRVIPKVTAAAANISFGNPSLSNGSYPSFWSPGQLMRAQDSARMTLQAVAFSAGVRAKIPFNAPDAGRSYLSVASGTVTINETGLYAINGSFRFSGATDVSGSRGIMSIRLNGVASDLRQQESTGGPVKAASYRLILRIDTTILLNEGDTLELWGFSEVAASFPADATYNFATITKVGN